MELIIFVTGFGMGIAAWGPLYALLERRAARKASPAHSPTPMGSILVTSGPYPSLSDADLEECIERTRRDERRRELSGYHDLAADDRDKRRRYEAELARRRAAAQTAKAV